MRKRIKKERKTIPTLKFMLKTALKNKPQIFIAYAILTLTAFMQTMVNIISSKYLVDELVSIIGGGAVEQHLPVVIICAALILGISMLTSLLNTVANQMKEVYG